ncbi:SUN domain-containing protein 2-like isoform X1 [Scyliorhinus canicula]|uniref:SUN domain-containing protein 2-like isoform X1 n=2 Tax=Scyliorhinus canicula TaxID=7830 RepID=UPI0018F75C66|nr:SUN domain-containing protein 2-like isoform X1 [Scyliorhinus canicula]XP_038639574.1 SUN domain-containing protein 2-like isoform X1 [Scyliorhinus canicula]XP_038639575.1 SUN domain-containing protein 2-like isoform X1 [Scyliorhinus canicula]
MSRRSTRLAASGYYQDDDDASSSSGGSVTGSVVSYKESPVRIFKKKPNAKRSGPTPRSTPVPSMKRSISNSSVNSQCSLASMLGQPINNDPYWQEPEAETVSEPIGGDPPGLEDNYERLSGMVRRANGYKRNMLSATPNSSDIYAASTSGYSSEDEQLGSAYSAPASPVAKLWNWISVLSPGKALSMVYWWLGTAWYQLTTAASLLDVYTLSRCLPSMKRWLLLSLLVLLGLLGVWLLISHRTARSRAEMPAKLERESSKWSAWPEKLAAPALDLSLQSRVQRMEQQLAQLASDFRTQLQQETKPSQQMQPARERETIPVEPPLTQDDVTKLLQEFVTQQREAVQDEVPNDSILRIQNNIAVVQQQQDARMEQLLQELNGQTEEMFREIQEAKSAFTSTVTDEQKSFQSALNQLEEQLGQTQLELMDVRTVQTNMASNVETLSSRIESMKDDVQAEVLKSVHRLLFGSSQDDTAVSSQQAFVTQFVNRKDLEALLHDLERKILANLPQNYGQTAKQNAGTVRAMLAEAGITEEVEDIVQKALKLYSADQIGMVDYALESAGASVISTRCSETFETKTALLSLFGVPLWYHSQSPRAVIQPDVHPGNCWAFKGSQGFVVIQLAARIRPTSFTLEHISKSVALHGLISSAPRDFFVYGLDNEIREEGLPLGQYMYDQDGDSIQTFQVQNKELGAFQVIELRVNSNWGHPEYTCLYRFRVHGEPVK